MFNWEPVILTMDRESAYKDYSLLKGINRDIKVYRAKGRLTDFLEKTFKKVVLIGLIIKKKGWQVIFL